MRLLDPPTALAFAGALALSLSIATGGCDGRASRVAGASAATSRASASASAHAPSSAVSSGAARSFDDPALGLAALCARAKIACPPGAPRLVVEKRARALTLFDGGVRVAAFPIALGPNPEGPKLREGDGRTPEGALRVVTRNEKSKYRRFLGLGYPTAADGVRGLREGMISRAAADAIARAERERAQPPWDTELGGAVGIHGHGSGLDWTAGCVALDDDAIDVLWAAVPIGAEVEVLP